ncbi:MAG TPA: cohesin domain-containing protein [Thermoanaerobaculia bacterium]|nr:cohesin domain-containing protein [Thermoanaerobaculia bacterium]
MFAGLSCAVLAALSASCGGGGGGGGGGGPTQPPPPSIIFSPASAGPSNAITLASGIATTANNLDLEVRAATVQNLFGVSFDLHYPTAVLRFAGRTEGTFLGAGGVPTTIQVVENPAGNLVVGLSRLGAVAGASGSGTLISLEFSRVAAGTGAFEFASPAAFDGSGHRITGLTFVAGSVQVTP